MIEPSHLTSVGPMPHSRAVLSSRVRIFGAGNIKGPNDYDSAKPELIGSITSFGVTQNRSLEPVRGIGLGDHIIEMVPGMSDPVELQVSKAALATANLFQEFGYAGGVDGFVRALKHHRYPVDIKQEILISKLAEPSTRSGRSGVSTTKPTNIGSPSVPSGANYWLNAEDLEGVATSPGFSVLITWYLGCWFENFSVTYGVDNAVISEEGSIKVTEITGHDNKLAIIPFATNNAQSKIWPKVQSTGTTATS